MKNNKKLAQSLIEYGLILALVAVIAITALRVLGQKINTAADNAAKQVETSSADAAKKYCEYLNKDYDEKSGACKDNNNK